MTSPCAPPSLAGFPAFRTSLDEAPPEPPPFTVLQAGEFGTRTGRGAGAVFETIAGELQSDYLTIWRLFDCPDARQHVWSPLARLVRNVRGRYHFDAILTATVTGAELLNRIREEVEEDGPIAVHVVPSAVVGSQQPEEPVAGLACLLLTDVVASGRQLADLVAFARRHGGTPVAVVAIATTWGEAPKRQGWFWVDTTKSPPTFVTERVPGDDVRWNITVPVFAGYHHQQGQVADAGGRARIPIDPATIYPADRVELENPPLCELATTIEHLERAEALGVGWYLAEGSLVFGAVRVAKLLAEPHVRADLRGRLKVRLQEVTGARGGAPRPVLVTPLTRASEALASLMEETLAPVEPCRVSLGHRDSVDMPYFTDVEQLGRVRAALDAPKGAPPMTGARVILAFGALNQASRLESVVSLLLSQGAAEIHVVCLLNRMGLYTTNFVGRVRSLFVRVGTPAQFSLTHVYELPDLGDDRTRRAWTDARRVYTRFAELTAIDAFHAQVPDRLAAYAPTDIASRAFLQGVPTPLPEPQTVAVGGGGTVTVTTLEAWVACLLTNLSPRRPGGGGAVELGGTYHPERVIEGLREIAGLPLDPAGTTGVRPAMVAAAVRAMVAVLLTEAALLRRQNGPGGSTRMAELRRVVLDQLLVVRAKQDPTALDPTAPLEALWLELAGAIAYHDVSSEEGKHLLDALPTGEVERHLVSRRAVAAYLRRGDVAFALAFWMHSAVPGLRQAVGARDFTAKLVGSLDAVEAWLVKRDGLTADELTADELLAARQQLDRLRAEAGGRRDEKPHTILRHLQKTLFSGPFRHNSLHMGLARVSADLDRRLGGQEVVYLGEDDPSLLNVEETLQRLSILHELIGQIRRFFRFAPGGTLEYTRPEDSQPEAGDAPGWTGLRVRLERIERVLRTVRDARRVWRKDAEDAQENALLLTDALFSPTSALVAQLQRYVPDLRGALVGARARSDGAAWGEWNLDLEGTAFVLCDPLLLHDTIDNVLLNATKHKNRGGRVSLHREPDSEGDRLEVRFESVVDLPAAHADRYSRQVFPGGKPRERSTLAGQFDALTLYDAAGRVEVKVEDERVRVVVILSFRERAERFANVSLMADASPPAPG